MRTTKLIAAACFVFIISGVSALWADSRDLYKGQDVSIIPACKDLQGKKLTADEETVLAYKIFDRDCTLEWQAVDDRGLVFNQSGRKKEVIVSEKTLIKKNTDGYYILVPGGKILNDGYGREGTIERVEGNLMFIRIKTSEDPAVDHYKKEEAEPIDVYGYAQLVLDASTGNGRYYTAHNINVGTPYHPLSPAKTEFMSFYPKGTLLSPVSLKPANGIKENSIDNTVKENVKIETNLGTLTLLIGQHTNFKTGEVICTAEEGCVRIEAEPGKIARFTTGGSYKVSALGYSMDPSGFKNDGVTDIKPTEKDMTDFPFTTIHNPAYGKK
ncbi:MAG: hypothetical protein ABIH01_01390 [Candidatus Omnitrophota bacterium]